MTRLPILGSDDNTWGAILNDFLQVEHNSDGTLKKSGDISTAGANASAALSTAQAAQNTANAAQAASQKGQAGGYAELDGSGKVPASQLPSASNAVTSVNTRTGDVTGLAENADLTAHTSNTSNPHSVTKSQVGLANVDNTSDVNKPVSAAQQTALNLKVTANSAIAGATKTKITYDSKGLVTAGADATTADISDSTNKRYVTDAQLTSLGSLSGTNTGDQDLSGLQPLDTDLTAIAGLAPSNDDVLQRKAGAWTNRTPAQLKTDLSLAKADVGLANVDNTSDANKPVSTAQQTALNLKANLASPTFTGTVTVPTPSNNTDAATKAYVDANIGSATWGALTGTLSDQTDLQTELDNKQNTIGYTPEDAANRDTDGTLSANNDTLYASQKATKTYADTKMARSGGLFTGAVIDSVVTLTDAATIAVDASLGNVFTVTLAASRTMGAPTNPTNGQKIILRLRQGGSGSYTITWDGAYRFGTDVTSPALSTTVGKTDYLGFIYNSTDSKWDCVAVSKGY